MVHSGRSLSKRGDSFIKEEIYCSLSAFSLDFLPKRIYNKNNDRGKEVHRYGYSKSFF